MALRVLLADESSTIKKVIQLALQDFSVEVKSVPVGLDVLSISESFKPHIIFVDVLLAKKSGYDVCKELKQNAKTMTIPTVLMWSGFMDLDESKFNEAKANGKLEKPFDSETLRSLVKKLVPFSNENKISDFLIMPKLPSFDEEGKSKNTASAIPQIPEDFNAAVELKLDLSSSKINSNSDSANFDALESEFNSAEEEAPKVEGLTESLDELSSEPIDELPIEFEEFQQVQLHSKNTPPSANLNSSKKEENWSETNLSKFMIPDVDGSKPQVQSSGEFEEITYTQNPIRKPEIKKTNTSISLSQTEQIIRDEARAVIEDISWKILPGIIERVVREEINKLLSEAEESI